MFFPDKNTGYVVGAWGTILKTTNGGGLVSINETEKGKSSISIFPNPAKSRITISTPSNLSGATNLSIYDIHGKRLIFNQIICSGMFEVNVSSLKTGIYFVNISTKEGVLTKKLVIQK